MTTVRINSLLQAHAELPAVAIVSGETVGDCLDDFIKQFPLSRTWLFSRESLLHVMISINTIEIVLPDKESLNRRLKPGDEIMMFAVAGGG